MALEQGKEVTAKHHKQKKQEQDRLAKIKEEVSKLREEDFVVPACDSRGRSTTVRTNVMPFLAREMEERLHARQFPFRTQGDMVRWCIFWGMQRLEAYQNGPGFLAYAWAENQFLKDEMYRREAKISDDMMEMAIAPLLRDGTVASQVRAYLLATEVYERTGQIRDRYWRTKKREEILKKFGDLLSDPPQVPDLRIGGGDDDVEPS